MGDLVSITCAWVTFRVCNNLRIYLPKGLSVFFLETPFGIEKFERWQPIMLKHRRHRGTESLNSVAAEGGFGLAQSATSVSSSESELKLSGTPLSTVKGASCGRQAAAEQDEAARLRRKGSKGRSNEGLRKSALGLRAIFRNTQLIAGVEACLLSAKRSRRIIV